MNKHNLSRADVLEVLAVNNITTHEFDMTLSSRDNWRVMLVGFNYAGRLLEIGAELISENKAYIFHGQDVSPKHRRLYKEWIINEQKDR